MKIRIFIFFCLISFPYIGNCNEKPYNSLTLNVTVVDENSNPIDGAVVQLSSPDYSATYNPLSYKGMSTSSGKVEFLNVPVTTLFYINAKARGFYDSVDIKEYVEAISNKDGVFYKNLVIKLREIKDPAPMYAKRVKALIPCENELIGFDFVVGDFVAPFGAGKETDFFIKLTRRAKERRNYNLEIQISFPKTGDGIINNEDSSTSKFKGKRNAPDGNYALSISFSKGQTTKKTWNTFNQQSFITRTRSVVDKDGNLIKACYGKLMGLDLAGYIADKPTVVFSYCFNPKYNRNLEFDINLNLLKGLRSTERVVAP